MRNAFTEAEDQSLFDMWHQGRPLSKICMALKRPRSSLEHRIIKLRLRGVDFPYRRPEFAKVISYNLNRAIKLAPADDYLGPPFIDDPRAKADRGTGRAHMGRDLAFSATGSSAAWAAQV